MPIAHGNIRMISSLHVAQAHPSAGQVSWPALWQLVTCGVLNAIAEPDSECPQCRENAAEEIHDRHHRARRDSEHLQQASADQRDPEERTRQHREHHRGYCRDAAGQGRGVWRQMVDLNCHWNCEAHDDGLHEQHCCTESLHSNSSPGSVSVGRYSPPAAPFLAAMFSAALFSGLEESSTRASPAVYTDPVMRTPAFPGPPSLAASASSASATPRSIASSSRSATVTRSGPTIVAATSASAGGDIDREAELAVATTCVTTGSSWSRMPATSLSSLTAMMAIRSVKVNASVSASTEAAMPPGLCAESTITTGLRLTTSSRPGDLMVATARRTISGSRAIIGSCSPFGDPTESGVRANASTAAIAHARLLAWCRPNSGRYRSG